MIFGEPFGPGWTNVAVEAVKLVHLDFCFLRRGQKSEGMLKDFAGGAPPRCTSRLFCFFRLCVAVLHRTRPCKRIAECLIG
ncbi:hypothetical protein MAC3UK_0041 [Bdellovibrio phage MAC3UK]|nr:hypothetical protein MAC3UK_0041 [Bdellovibrio phage MAC3UK]